jgi:hypothetical protein
VADFSSQSSHGVRSRRVCRGAVEGRRWPTGSVLLDPAQATRGCADCDRMGWAQRRGPAQPPPTLNVGRISLRSDRRVTHRAALVSGGSRRAPYNRPGDAFPIRSPPQQAWGRDCRGRRPTQDVALVQMSRQSTSRWSVPGRTPRTHQLRNEPSPRAPALSFARIRF